MRMDESLIKSEIPTVVLIGTLDTKGVEIAYARDALRRLGVRPFVIDSGILGLVTEVADMTREEVAIHAGSTLAKIQKSDSRATAVEAMSVGLAVAVKNLYQQGSLQGLLCFGGAEGALMGASAAHVLPLGIPKVILSPSASGRRQFGPFIGESDVTIMHSVIDILGLNSVARAVYDNAVAAVVGMVKWAGKPPVSDKPCIGITMLGQTTPGAMLICKQLEAHGFEPIIFHANGVGGPAMDNLVLEGKIVGVIEFTISEIANSVKNGIHSTPPDRMTAAVKAGIPLLLVPGAADFFNLGALKDLPAEYKSRKVYRHNSVATLVRMSDTEMKTLGRILVKRMHQATAPTAVLVPTEGFSLIGKAKGAIEDRQSDDALIKVLEDGLPKHIPVIKFPLDINDENFAIKVSEKFLEMMGAAGGLVDSYNLEKASRKGSTHGKALPSEVSR
jgi:uncharacterized protein (UPF0261 family)